MADLHSEGTESLSNPNDAGDTGALDLTRLFRPLRLAVIGAHDSKAPFDFMFKQLESRVQRSGGEIFPVNPRLDSVFGHRTYATLDDVPGDLDVVVILIADVVGSMQQVVRKRPKFVVVHASGFSEGGAEEGRKAEQELVELAQEAGARLVGPNTNMNMFELLDESLTPKYGIVTQSGHQGRPLAAAQSLGYGVSHWVTTGNEADLGTADFVEYMAHDESTRSIASYVEGFTSGTTLRRAAAASIGTGTPWVLVKVGASEQAAAAAMSHTGKLAGSDAALDAFFEQHAIHRVDDLDELIDVAAVLARASALPEAEGVAVVSASGGTAAHLVDVLASAGLQIPDLLPATQERLRELIPAPLNVTNPIDNGGYALLRGTAPAIIDAVMDDPGIGILVLPVSEPLPAMRQPIIETALHAHARGDKPVIAVSLMPSTDEPVFTAMTEAGVPYVRNMRNAASAARALLNHPLRRFPEGRNLPVPDIVAESIDRPGRVLSEKESLDWLSAHGLEAAPHEYVPYDEDIADAAGRLGYPVVLKAVVVGLAHKSERYAVRVDLRDRDALRSAEEDMRHEFAEEDIRGFIVASHLSGGVELLVGISRDPLLGPIVMVGAGGTAAEAVKDTTISVLPFDDARAELMVQSLRISPLLGPWRGRPALDVGAVVDVIGKLRSIAEQGEVIELDVNPLLVREKGAVMLDAVVSLAGPGREGEQS